MSTKRIVLIIMCGLLVLMGVLMAMVVSEFMPFLALLRPQEDPVIQAPSSTAAAPTQPSTTTQAVTPTLPTQPPIITEPGHVHDFQFTRLVNPTCESPGYSLYTCSCNMLDMRDMKNPLGHTYGAGKKFTFCEEEGYTEYVCTVCEYADRQNITEPLGHDYEVVEVSELSCTEDGYELKRCSRCEDEIRDNYEPAPGHSDFEWVETLAPGVGEPGEEVRQCSVCPTCETRPCVMSVMGVNVEDQGDRMEYTVYVGTTATPQALTYFIKDYSKSVQTIEYTTEGLKITDSEASADPILLPPLENGSVTIDADGVPSGGTPAEPGEPPVESGESADLQQTDPDSDEQE